jgi:hypothetical protein
MISPTRKQVDKETSRQVDKEETGNPCLSVTAHPSFPLLRESICIPIKYGHQRLIIAAKMGIEVARGGFPPSRE